MVCRVWHEYRTSWTRDKIFSCTEIFLTKKKLNRKLFKNWFWTVSWTAIFISKARKNINQIELFSLRIKILYTYHFSSCLKYNKLYVGHRHRQSCVGRGIMPEWSVCSHCSGRSTWHNRILTCSITSFYFFGRNSLTFAPAAQISDSLNSFSSALSLLL